MLLPLLFTSALLLFSLRYFRWQTVFPKRHSSVSTTSILVSSVLPIFSSDRCCCYVMLWFRERTRSSGCFQHWLATGTASIYKTTPVALSQFLPLTQLWLPMPTISVGVGRMFESVCLFVCPHHNSKMNDPKVFKLGIGNNLEVVLFWSSKVTGSVSSFRILEPY